MNGSGRATPAARRPRDGARARLLTSHVETLADDGSVRRHATATAVYGQAGDRMLLFETVRERSCDATSGGSYVVLDTQRRLWLDVGRLGVLGGDVWRRSDGLGFVVGDFDDAERWPKGVALDGEGLVRLRVNKKGLAGGSPETQLAAWGMDPTPARSGVAGEVGAPPQGCAGATEDQVARLPASLQARPSGASRWISCALGNGGALMLHASPTCPGPWALAILDGTGAVASQKEGPDDGRSPRLWPTSTGGFVVELDRAGGDDANLFTVAADGTVTDAIPGAGHVLRPPAACGCEGATPPPADG